MIHKSLYIIHKNILRWLWRPIGYCLSVEITLPPFGELLCIYLTQEISVKAYAPLCPPIGTTRSLGHTFLASKHSCTPKDKPNPSISINLKNHFNLLTGAPVKRLTSWRTPFHVPNGRFTLTSLSLPASTHRLAGHSLPDKFKVLNFTTLQATFTSNPFLLPTGVSAFLGAQMPVRIWLEGKPNRGFP